MIEKHEFNADWIKSEMEKKGITYRYFCKETGVCSPSTLCKYFKESAVPVDRWHDFELALHDLGLCELNEHPFTEYWIGVDATDQADICAEGTVALSNGATDAIDSVKYALNKLFGFNPENEIEEETVMGKIYPKKFTKKCSDIRKYWGDQMPMLAVEEAAEFTQAISKMERWHNSEEKDYEELQVSEDNLIEEMADILISIECVRQLYGIEVGEVRKMIKKKQKKRY